MATFFILLMVLGASTAFPTEDETRPTNAVGAPAVGPEPVGPEPVGPVTDLHPGSTPDQEQGPGQESGPEGSDLKTDNTYWWRRSYYPYGYGRSYYPRVYSYYTPRVYSYYSPYSYWGSYW